MQLNNVIRSFEGLPVTFYTHLVSDEFTDTLECESGIPFSDEIARLFYASREGKPFYQRRLFFTVCFNPHTGIERATMKQKSTGERKTLLDNALQVMQEHRQAIGTALSRYAARPLGTYEENGHVFSSQMAFYNFLITGRWQKVRVTRTPFYDVLGGTDIFLPPTLARSATPTARATFAGWKSRITALKPSPGCMTRFFMPAAGTCSRSPIPAWVRMKRGAASAPSRNA